MPSSSALPGAAVADCRPLARFAVAAIASLLIAPASAADPPLSFAETLRIAVERSPQLESQRAMVDAAREMAGPAGELPDPEAEARRRKRADQRRRQLVAHARLHDDVEDRRDAGIPARGKAQAALAARGERRAARHRHAGVDAARRHARDGGGVARPLVRGRGRTPDRAPDRRGRARGHDRARRRIAPARRRRGSSSMRRATSIELRNRATDAAAQSKRARIALARLHRRRGGPSARQPARPLAAAVRRRRSLRTSTPSRTSGWRSRAKPAPRPKRTSRARRKSPTGARS